MYVIALSSIKPLDFNTVAMSVFPVTEGVTTFMPAPEGYHVNFERPQSQYRHEHFHIFGFLGSLALLCLVQRLYAKRFIVGGLKVDDCTSRHRVRHGSMRRFPAFD